MDKLIETYSTKERENALKYVGKDDYILRSLEDRRNEKIINKLLSRERSRSFRRKKYEERLSLLDNYDLPPRRHPSQISSLRVLSGDYLDLLSDYDDYDYGEDTFDYDERVRSSSLGRFSSAARESRIIERQLKNLLRNSS